MNIYAWMDLSDLHHRTISLSRVKGIVLTYENAVNKTFNDATETMIGTILPQLLESVK